jgi:hypothetical protein
MRIFLSVFLLPITLVGNAQKSERLSTTQHLDSTWALTASPLALLQLDYTLMGGAEYRLSPRVKLVADAGWIFASSIYGTEEGAQGASGFIIRPGIKYFPSRPNNYLQVQLFYKQVTHRLNDWLDKDVDNGVAAYQQMQEFRYRRTALGINFLLGLMRQLGRSKNLFADFYLGAGIRFKGSAVVGEDGSRYEQPGAVIIGDGETNAVLPSIPGGVRLIFFLR